jgi:signal transduction histidine kinase
VEGSGATLALARRLARGCGGDLWVEDAPEGGTAWWIRLPGPGAEGTGDPHPM